MRRSYKFMPLPRSLEYHIQRALSSAERLFKTDIRYLLRGGFWGFLGQTASSLAALALSIAFSRLLPKEVYGEYKFILAFISVLGAMSLNGIGTAVFQSAARGFGGALPEGFWVNLRWSLFVFLGAFASGEYYLSAGHTLVGVGILIGGCFVPLIASANLYAPLLSGKKDFRRYALYGIANTVVPVISLILTVLIAPTLLAILSVYFLSNTLVGLLLYWCTYRAYHTEMHTRDPGTLTYAKHLSVIGILSAIAGNIDQLFLFHYIGAIEVAVYNFAVGILDQSKGPLKMLDAMVQARFANQETRSIRDNMRNKMLWLFIFSVLIVVSYILVAPYLYQILFPTYMSSVLYSQIYALSLLGTFVNPAGSYLTAKKKVKEQYINSIFNSILQITAILGSILFWGLFGLIIARVFIRLAGAFVTYVLYRKAIANDHTYA